MKLIKAYLRSIKVEDVYVALNKAGFCCMTFVKCVGTGSYADKQKEHVNAEYTFIEGYKVVKLEIVAANENVDTIVGIIKENGRTGYPGDGIITISPVDEVYKIRNTETGSLAI